MGKEGKVWVGAGVTVKELGWNSCCEGTKGALLRLKAVKLIRVMGDTVDGQVRGITGRVERMEIREKEHRLPGNF